MKFRLPLVSSFLCLIATMAFAAPADKSAAPDKPAGKKVIEKGMTGEEITQLFGQPVEIKPMKMDDPITKAEQWIYRRKLKETTSSTSIAPNSSPDVSFSDASQLVPFQSHVPVVQYRIQRTTIHQVTALLMVNGRLEVAKQWTERTQDYD